MSDDIPARPDDDALIDALRRVIDRVDPVPQRVREAARGSYTWRTIDAELAELARDSALEAEFAAGVRAEGGRRLTFESPALTIDIEIEGDEATQSVLGQLAPPQTAEVTVQHGGGTAVVQADELGRFTIDGVDRGPLALSFTLANGVTVKTEWLAL